MSAPPPTVDHAQLVEAFDWANLDESLGAAAYICRSTGRIFRLPDEEEVDRPADRSADLADPTRYVALPRKRVLGLGSALACEFAAREVPADESTVRDLFRRRGGFGRFRRLLQHRGLVDAWHRFQEARTGEVLAAWAEGEGFRVVGGPATGSMTGSMTGPAAAVGAVAGAARGSSGWRATLLGPGDESVLHRVAEGVFDHDVRPSLARAVLADPANLVAVALEGDLVVGMATGFAYLHPDKPLHLFVNEVGVAASHRRCGIGRRLVELLLERAAEMGCTEAWVATEEHNAAARRLFGSLDGREDGARAVVFHLPLPKRR